jgi:hypothetical protein
MQRCTQKARWEFIHLMMKHANTVPEYEARNAALKLLRYGATLGRIAENQCNGYDSTGRGDWDERAAKRDEAKEARILARAEKLCTSIGCKMVTQGDPRGNTLKIQVPDGYTNDWGREGICVPTS